MAIISSTGLFSGLETNKIIDQLMSLERRPLEILTKKKTDYETKISTYGNFTSLLTSLKNTLSALKKNSFMSINATSSDSTVFTATAKSSATEGIYNIKITRIATSQNIYSQIFGSTDEAVADLSQYGTQKIQIQVGSNTPMELTIDGSNNTLSGIRDAINNAGADIKASIINDGLGYRLVLNSIKSGASNRIVIKVDENNDGIFEEFPDDVDNSGLSRLAFNATYDEDGNVVGGITNLSQSQAGVDALLSLNGLEISRSSNTINDAISGVTLNLFNNSGGRVLTLNISKDTAKIMSNINSFVSAYKSILDAVKKTSSDKSSPLNSDSALRLIAEGLRSSMRLTYEGKSLLKFGFSHDKYGVPSVDGSSLEDSIKNNLSAVINTFDVVVTDMESKINTYINSLMTSRTDGLKSSIKFIDSKIENIERILEKKEMEYRKSFIALEKTVMQLQQSGDFLTRQFSTLSKINGGNK